jgi:AraC-like DNA-binding protein
MTKDSFHLLDDVLRAVRLRSTVYFRAAFHSPWGMELPASEVANFHLVCKGKCWLTAASLDAPIALEAGDMVLCPRGHAHELRDLPEGQTIPAQELIKNPISEPSSNAPPAGEESIAFGGVGDTTSSLICGHYEYNREISHPLFDALPPVVCIKAGSGDDQLNEQIVSMANALIGLDAERIGAAALDRLAEALFICCVNAYSSGAEEERLSFIAAAQDKQIGQAISQIHQDIAREWHLQDLAEAAAMSRSVFSDRFRELVGVSPMVYVAKWRMLKAHQMLLETSLPIARISEQVGYQSEFAFAKAFKKNLGITPGQARRTGTA